MAKEESKKKRSASESPFKRGLGKTKAAKSRDPQFEAGVHDVTFLNLEERPPVEGKDDYIVGSFLQDGEKRAVLFCMSRKAQSMSNPRLKSLGMAITQADSEDEYDAWEESTGETGDFLDALLGYDNPKAEDAAGYKGTAIVRVTATLGGEAPDGTNYVNCSFDRPPASADADEDAETAEPAPKKKRARK